MTRQSSIQALFLKELCLVRSPWSLMSFPLFFLVLKHWEKRSIAYLEGAEDAGFPHAGVSGKLPETPPEDIEMP